MPRLSSVRLVDVIPLTGTTVAVLCFLTMAVRGRSLAVLYDLFLFHNGPSGVLLLWLGWLVLRRLPDHAAGWTMTAIGALSVLHVAIATFADLRLVASGRPEPLFEVAASVDAPSSLPLDATLPIWVMNWLWVPIAVGLFGVLPALYPDGRLASARWRAVPVLLGAGTLLMVVASMAEAWPTSSWRIEDRPEWIGLLMGLAALLLVAGVMGSLAGLLTRWRKGDLETRRRYQPLGVATGLTALALVAIYPWPWLWVPVILVGIAALLSTYALGVGRYGLHDVEPVVGKAAVAATGSLLVASVYLGLVVGAGHLLGRQWQITWLPLVAIAAVALLAGPTHRRVAAWVDRRLYGRSAGHVEVLSELAARTHAGGAVGIHAEVADLLLRSTGAARAEVVLDRAGEDSAAPVGEAGRSRHEGERPVMTAVVTDEGAPVGVLQLYARSTADLVPEASAVLDDVAHAVGLVARIDDLNDTLRRQLEELRDSRQRLVEAQVRARRELERDIHDGAQARLIALRARVGVLRANAATDTAAVRWVDELDELGLAVDTAVRSLRDLARGLHPPVLEQAGLPAALRSYTRGLPTKVSIAADSIGRYREPVEVAAYFCCLEAIQNATRHAGASTIRVDLGDQHGALVFSVVDDGVGFESGRGRGTGIANMDDRAAALGGSVTVQSQPGRGTRVEGRIPAQAAVSDR